MEASHRDFCLEVWSRILRKKLNYHILTNLFFLGVLEKDVTQHAKSVLKILQHAARIRERITPLKIVDAWLGKGQLNLRVPTVQPPSLTAGSCERIVLLLLLKKIVKEDFHFTPYSTICYLVEGPRNNMVLTDKMKVFMDFEQSSSKSAKVLLADFSSSQSKNANYMHSSN